MIPLNNLSQTIQRRHLNLPKITQEVFDSGSLILGDFVQSFEYQFAGYIGEDSKVVSCANGTDALYLAVKSGNLAHGSIVATVANAGFYSTNAILRAGHSPLYLDVDLQTGLVLFEEVERAISLGVSAIIVTHLFGLPIPYIGQIAEICSFNQVLLIEDCAQAHGARVAGQHVGTFGDLGTYSFYPSKNLGALGDGGAVSTRDPLLLERIVSLRQYGWGSKYEVDLAGGLNSRMDAVQANLLTHFLPFLNLENAMRAEVASRYMSGIKNPRVVLPTTEVHSGSVWHLFVVRVPTGGRAELQEVLTRSSIETAIHYPQLDFHSRAYPSLRPGFSLVNSEMRLQEILTLPLYPYMEAQLQARVIEVINEWS